MNQSSLQHSFFRTLLKYTPDRKKLFENMETKATKFSSDKNFDPGITDFNEMDIQIFYL